MDNKLIGNEKNILFYCDEEGNTKVEVLLENEDVWLNAEALSKLFNIDRSGIVRHINNIYKDEELDENSTCAKIAHMGNEGKQTKSEKAANRVLASITKFIEKKLGLKVNAEKSKVTRPTQTKYLGFSFWRSPKGQWKPKPHLKSYQKLVRKLKQLTDRSWSISLDNRIKKINYVVRGWVNYFRIANMRNKITEIDEHLRVRIRVIIWKQWKKIRKKCESLQKLGVSFEIAFNCANTRKGYYQICKIRYIQFAINNERLRKRGLVFLLDQYEKVHI